MKEREKKRAEKQDQAAAEGRPSGSGGGRLGTVRASGGSKFCVCEAETAFFLWVWTVKKNNERFWRLGSKKFLGFTFIRPFFLFMISQILIYGLLISEIKD